MSLGQYFTFSESEHQDYLFIYLFIYFTTLSTPEPATRELEEDGSMVCSFVFKSSPFLS